MRFTLALLMLTTQASFIQGFASLSGSTPASSSSSDTCSNGRSSSSSRRASHATISASSATKQENDLLVVGMGTLGSMLGKIWKDMHGPDVQVYGETFSTTRHEELKRVGVQPILRGERQAINGQTFSNVVFCVPPSKNEDYLGEVQGAMNLWSGKGTFVFTSSGGVFAEDNGGRVDESSPVTSSPRMAKILDAERYVVGAGGLVLRLAGLYTETRGPHTFWLARGEVGASEQGMINLLHYEDAARATIAGLLHTTKEVKPRVLLVSDDHPMTRRQICEAAVTSPMYKGKYKLPVFKTPEGGSPLSLGKVYDTTNSRQVLGGWEAKYLSFSSYMAHMKEPSNSMSSV